MNDSERRQSHRSQVLINRDLLGCIFNILYEIEFPNEKDRLPFVYTSQLWFQVASSHPLVKLKLCYFTNDHMISTSTIFNWCFVYPTIKVVDISSIWSLAMISSKTVSLSSAESKTDMLSTTMVSSRTMSLKTPTLKESQFIRLLSSWIQMGKDNHLYWKYPLPLYTPRQITCPSLEHPTNELLTQTLMELVSVYSDLEIIEVTSRKVIVGKCVECDKTRVMIQHECYDCKLINYCFECCPAYVEKCFKCTHHCHLGCSFIKYCQSPTCVLLTYCSEYCYERHHNF